MDDRSSWRRNPKVALTLTCIDADVYALLTRHRDTQHLLLFSTLPSRSSAKRTREAFGCRVPREDLGVVFPGKIWVACSPGRSMTIAVCRNAMIHNKNLFNVAGLFWQLVYNSTVYNPQTMSSLISLIDIYIYSVCP